ncbi:putative disease resistance RPP13-like protein 1 [Cornus florida]|uniref:putative disease resistance RPP13-like protein 1 n=1 Tax=Cornus florida TaxID=4283 RepID=UPI00289BBBB7|nr:putative disease resistance RPP13-like protein 1 [Cornus florida]
MHDLMNDLAQFVAGEICFRANDNFDGNEQSTISKRTRHLSYTSQRLQNKRVTKFRLQLEAFTISQFILYFNPTALSKIIVGKSNGSRLTELKHLLHLCGKLSIVKLENVMDVGEAMEANLMGMKDLDELELGWSEDFDDSRSTGELEMHVLNALEPQRKLKKLKVEFYRGASFPTWMGNPTFSKMVNLSLRGCIICESLPPPGQLPLLKDLLIKGMHGVKSIGAEFCKYDYPLESPFPSLESNIRGYAGIGGMVFLK